MNKIIDFVKKDIILLLLVIIILGAMSFLLIKNAISGDEGLKTIKKLALISLIPAGLFVVAQAINFTNLETALTNFFIIIRRLLIVFDFAIDTDLLISLLLTTFGISVAFWTYRAYKFVITFFTER